MMPTRPRLLLLLVSCALACSVALCSPRREQQHQGLNFTSLYESTLARRGGGGDHATAKVVAASQSEDTLDDDAHDPFSECAVSRYCGRAPSCSAQERYRELVLGHTKAYAREHNLTFRQAGKGEVERHKPCLEYLNSTVSESGADGVFDDKIGAKAPRWLDLPSLENAARPHTCTDGEAIYHSFWKLKSSDDSFPRAAKLSLLSFIATQDIFCSWHYLWLVPPRGPETEDDGSNSVSEILETLITTNVHLQELLELDGVYAEGTDSWQSASRPVMVIRLLQIDKLITETRFRPPPVIGDRAFSDYVRFLVLNRFGGVYFDLDVLLLRDFRSILDREFAEWWGTSRWDINTAILRLEANSSLIHAILDGVYQIIEEASTHEYAKAKENSVLPLSLVHPKMILEYIAKAGLEGSFQIFPNAFFDPSWGFEGIPSFALKKHTYNGILHAWSFFNETECQNNGEFGICELDNFYPGSFAYHWHNQWSRVPTPNSFFVQFETLYTKIAQWRLELLSETTKR